MCNPSEYINYEKLFFVFKMQIDAVAGVLQKTSDGCNAVN